MEFSFFAQFLDLKVENDGDTDFFNEPLYRITDSTTVTGTLAYAEELDELLEAWAEFRGWKIMK